MIFHASISSDRVTYTVHLQDEDDYFFIVPIENDGSDNWNRLQLWLDEGNSIVDDLPSFADMYADLRRPEYPALHEQLDKLFHDIQNGTLDQTGEFFTAIKTVKETFPKPAES